MTELTFTLPWPPSINSMYSQGIIGAKRNLEDPFCEVIDRLVTEQLVDVPGDIRAVKRVNSKLLRGMVQEAFGKPRASMFLSQAGKDYRAAAEQAINAQQIPRHSLAGRLAVKAIAHPPDARTRDLDNLWKSALDVLKHNQVITDDGFIDDLQIRRGAQQKGGAFLISVREIREAFESRQQGLDLAQAS